MDASLQLISSVLQTTRSMNADGRVIVDAQDDDTVFGLLSSALNERIPSSLLVDLDAFVAQLQKLPPGLRAMAATHQLDVSMSLDDLGWHFANWHDHGLAEETTLGLRE